jgi:hypothetical protein
MAYRNQLTPSKLEKYASTFESIAKRARALAEKARSLHLPVGDEKVRVHDNLTPDVFDGVTIYDLQNIIASQSCEFDEDILKIY